MNIQYCRCRQPSHISQSAMSFNGVGKQLNAMECHAACVWAGHEQTVAIKTVARTKDATEYETKSKRNGKYLKT